MHKVDLVRQDCVQTMNIILRGNLFWELYKNCWIRVFGLFIYNEISSDFLERSDMKENAE